MPTALCRYQLLPLVLRIRLRNQELGIKNWPIWTCDTSSFDWTYDDQETCLLIEGEVTVTPNGGEPVKFGAGDLVVFPAGMDCRWDVHKGVRKHYRFGD